LIAKLAVSGFRKFADVIEEASGARGHGPWCEPSRDWAPSFPEGRIVPLRVGEEYIDKMLREDGWEAQIGAVLMRPAGDGTFQMLFREADDVDHAANRTVQRMVMAALDLAQALEFGNDDLSEDAVNALAEFKKASRSRIGGGTAL
jgi:hypothetical protein